MSEFWKSIPKIYCKYCNVWYQDNKSSKDFHERSFKHKNNINRHIFDIKKRGHEKQKEEDEFKREMQKIERAAIAAYEKDLVNSNRPINQSSSNKPSTSYQTEIKESNDNLRQEALDIVTTKLKKKHEWYECKTIEGKIYYYNKQTMETKWTEPKSGFVSIEDQKELNITGVPGDQSKSNNTNEIFKHEQFSSNWNQVSNDEVDLQLPKFKVKRKIDVGQLIDVDKESIEFKEKILDNEISLVKNKNQSQFSFKKRKMNTGNRRIKTDD